MTVVDVAKLARVSVATVSRVMNNSPRVRPETSQQVRAALAQLPASKQGRVRRGPRQGKRTTNHLQRVMLATLGQAPEPWFAVPVMAAVMSGIMHEAARGDVAVQIDEAVDIRELGSLLTERVAGALLFVSADMHDPLAEHIENRQAPLPIVRVMGESMRPAAFDHVGPDNAAIGQLAYEYLRGRACVSLSFMTVVPAWDLIRMRAHGFQAAACAAGEPAPMMFITASDAPRCEYYGARVYGRTRLEELVDEFLATARRPAGLFVPRDGDAVSIQRLLLGRGAKMGKDVILISCDNEEIRLSGLDPRPASIELGAREIGARALRQLFWRIENPNEPPVRMQVTPNVVEGT